jgi:hypothetical protein
MISMISQEIPSRSASGSRAAHSNWLSSSRAVATMANSGRQRLAGAVRDEDAALRGRDAADDHEVIVVVQRTGADAETAARELSFAAERL